MFCSDIWLAVFHSRSETTYDDLPWKWFMIQTLATIIFSSIYCFLDIPRLKLSLEKKVEGLLSPHLFIFLVGRGLNFISSFFMFSQAEKKNFNLIYGANTIFLQYVFEITLAVFRCNIWSCRLPFQHIWAKEQLINTTLQTGTIYWNNFLSDWHFYHLYLYKNKWVPVLQNIFGCPSFVKTGCWSRPNEYIKHCWNIPQGC